MSERATGRDPAHERIGEILRTALPSDDEAPIEDATRRLMLHLSLERPEPPSRPQAQPEPQPAARAGLLRQMLRRPGKRAR